MTFLAGQRYRVDGEYAQNPAVCTIEAVATPAELPQIAGAPSVEEVRAILDEFGIERVLMLSFPDGDTTMVFCAMVCRDGVIRDLHKQRLTLEELA